MTHSTSGAEKGGGLGGGDVGLSDPQSGSLSLDWVNVWRQEWLGRTNGLSRPSNLLHVEEFFNIIVVYIFLVFANQKKEYSYKIGGHDDDDDDTDDDDDDNDDVSLW